MEQAIRELSRFLGISYEETKKRMDSYTVMTAAELWNKRNPQTVKEVEKFYKEDTDFYLYELIHWNYTSPLYTERITPLLHYHDKKILEIGGGIGTLCIALAYASNQVTYCDISDVLSKFAKQRFTDRGLTIPIVRNLKGLKGFDIVVGIDFFEHIPKDALPGLLKEIMAVLNDEGFIYHRSNWGNRDVCPVHYDHSEYFNKMATDAGFTLRNNGDLVKSKRSGGVQIGIPIIGDIKDELFYSLMEMKKPPNTLITKIVGGTVDVARNQIIDKMERDWIFFMDSDQTFPPETLERLLNWDVPIVSGLYFKPYGKPVPHAYKYMWEEAKKYDQEEDPADHFYISMVNEVAAYLAKYYEHLVKTDLPTALLPPKKEDLIECDGVGGGCLLIHKRVFDALEKPYFKCNPGTLVGEDFYFCRKAREAGFKIYLDAGILCGHRQRGLTGYRHFMNWFSTATRKDFEWPFPWGEA